MWRLLFFTQTALGRAPRCHPMREGNNLKQQEPKCSYRPTSYTLASWVRNNYHDSRNAHILHKLRNSRSLTVGKIQFGSKGRANKCAILEQFLQRTWLSLEHRLKSLIRTSRWRACLLDQSSLRGLVQISEFLDQFLKQWKAFCLRRRQNPQNAIEWSMISCATVFYIFFEASLRGKQRKCNRLHCHEKNRSDWEIVICRNWGL